MKNLPKHIPSLEVFTRYDDRVDVTLDRPSKAELGLPHKRRCRPGAQSAAEPLA